jgi:hypothetical protein
MSLQRSRRKYEKKEKSAYDICNHTRQSIVVYTGRIQNYVHTQFYAQVTRCEKKEKSPLTFFVMFDRPSYLKYLFKYVIL